VLPALEKQPDAPFLQATRLLARVARDVRSDGAHPISCGAGALRAPDDGLHGGLDAVAEIGGVVESTPTSTVGLDPAAGTYGDTAGARPWRGPWWARSRASMLLLLSSASCSRD
jgi:hypothetical protein